MINAHVRLRHYTSVMLGIRQPRVFRGLMGGAPDLKRLGDFVIACIALTGTLPLMLIVALAIKLESAGPILGRRECIGRGGRLFQRLKFRTTMHDPRHGTPAWGRPTTPVGEFLRYTRIEDLPQLVNVLRGEMSIIDRDARSLSFLD